MATQDANSTSSSRRTTPPRHTPTRTSGSGTPSGTGTPRHMANKKPLPVFNSYMSLFQVQEKLKKGEVIEVRCPSNTLLLQECKSYQYYSIFVG